MDRWITIESTTIPGSDTELTLSQCNDDFAIRVSGLPGDLMNSRMHHSEDALACECSRTHTLRLLGVPDQDERQSPRTVFYCKDEGVCPEYFNRIHKRIMKLSTATISAPEVLNVLYRPLKR